MDNQEKWSEWKTFPDSRKGDYLWAPFGYGVYQLRDTANDKLVLFGSGKNCAYRVSSLLPKPYGQGTRNNSVKREYVMKNIDTIEYRTIAFKSEIEMMEFEKSLKSEKKHLFNS